MYSRTSDECLIGLNSLEEGMEHLTIVAVVSCKRERCRRSATFDQGVGESRDVKDLSHVTVGSSPGHRTFLADPIGTPSKWPNSIMAMSPLRTSSYISSTMEKNAVKTHARAGPQARA